MEGKFKPLGMQCNWKIIEINYYFTVPSYDVMVNYVTSYSQWHFSSDVLGQISDW